MGYNEFNGTTGAVLSPMAYLGPTIVTKTGLPINVTIKNDLAAAPTDAFPTWVHAQHRRA